MPISLPYLLFLGAAAPDQLAVKTAQGIVQWRRERCVGQWRLPGCRADVGLSDMDLDQAIAAGVRTVVLGTFVLREKWVPLLAEALARGLDLASGLHRRLADVPALAAAASRHGRRLFDVRRPTCDFAVGTGLKRPGKRLLTVGVIYGVSTE